MISFCPRCGVPRQTDMRYCARCGLEFASFGSSIIATPAPVPTTASTKSRPSSLSSERVPSVRSEGPADPEREFTRADGGVPGPSTPSDATASSQAGHVRIGLRVGIVAVIAALTLVVLVAVVSRPPAATACTSAPSFMSSTLIQGSDVPGIAISKLYVGPASAIVGGPPMVRSGVFGDPHWVAGAINVDGKADLGVWLIGGLTPNDLVLGVNEPAKRSTAWGAIAAGGPISGVGLESVTACVDLTTGVATDTNAPSPTLILRPSPTAAVFPEGVAIAPPYRTGPLTISTAAQLRQEALDNPLIANFAGSDLAGTTSPTIGYLAEYTFSAEASETEITDFIAGVDDGLKTTTTRSIDGQRVVVGSVSGAPVGTFRLGLRFYLVATFYPSDFDPVVTAVIDANR